ncbi:hypothetical protein GGR57DRAFT_301020 [Xylariaceae sp. FL1272]|nr:hypothetical protein GGR57DRAFT_301020 [Xylariaceae sp. FL1272]
MTDVDNFMIVAFGGALTVSERSHPQRAFALEATFHLDRLGDSRGVGKEGKPPLHFHPHQDEYVEVLQGKLVVEVEGRINILEPGHPEFSVRRWHNHRLYHLQPPDVSGDGETQILRFLLSGESTKASFKLDKMFFQNWYGYQDAVVTGNIKASIFQTMSMFDAGGSYLSLPTWVPFSRSVALASGIVVGRCLGGLLGYQPYYRQWTSEWELACEKMRSSLFHRKFKSS